MRTFWKISITLLVFLLCALAVTSASAFTTDFPKQYRLWQGTAAMHEIGVYGYCGTQVTVQSSFGTAFDIYAMRNYGSAGTCPSNEYIMNHYDRFTVSSGRTASLYLEPGLWCVVVYARQGSGTAYVTAESNCHPPAPTPPPIPPVPPVPPCSPFKTVDRSGFLYQGQAHVIGYYIPTDGRSQIEWILSSSRGSTPIIAASADGQVVSSLSSFSPFGTNFDIYVFKDCNPQYSYCNTNYYARGPNPYVSIGNPSRGSTYYVMIYARSGSGSYNIRMNSYKCFQTTPIIVASAPITAASVEYDFTTAGTGTGADTAVTSAVSAPSANFVSASSQ